jgi:hypothetical protein
MTDLDYLIIQRRLCERTVKPTSMEPLAFWCGEPVGWVFAIACDTETKKRLECTRPVPVQQ